MNQFPQIVVKHNIGNIITVPNQLETKVTTYISDNKSVGTTTLPVDNATDFTSGGSILLLLSSLGAENAEIITSASHTSTAFTTAATTQAHNRGDSVAEVGFDQVVVLKSATLTGVYTTLSTTTFQVTQQNTVINDLTGLSTDYYKVQWKNSVTAAVSSTSSPISVATFSPDSVAQVIYPVLRAMGVSENDTKINTTFCLSAVNDARKFTKAKLYGIRHAWNQAFEYPIQVLSGNNYVNLPTDIDFSETDQSLLATRFLLGNVLSPYNLKYIDKRSWNQMAFNVMGGDVTVAANIADVELTLSNVGDFPNTASGVAYVATTATDQTLLQITYTSIDLSTNRLLGVTGITRAIPAGTRVWARPTISQPIAYTVYDGKIVFDRIIPDSMQGLNVYIDYYKKLDEVEDLYQVLPENYREIYKWYLRYAIKYRKDIALGSDDPDLKKFEDLVQSLFNNLYTGQDQIIITG
jgi:hypothetical protein